MKKEIKFAIVAVLLCAAIAMVGCKAATSNNITENNKAILVVSFGTSYNESRSITIGAIESAIRENFPDYEVRRAFTAQIIIDKIQQRDGIQIDNVKQALDKLVADGFQTIIVQPTHLMNGYEYDDVMAELEKYKSKFKSVAVGKPLLTSDDDFIKVIRSITTRTASYADGKTAVVFMGHGTEHEADTVYATMQKKLTAAGHSNYFVGTVEGKLTLNDVITAIKAGGFTKVVLEPLMVVAGDHANNDMAGDEEGSWKTAFKAEGIEVQSILEGLGQYNEIQDIYVQHIKDAIQSVK